MKKRLILCQWWGNNGYLWKNLPPPPPLPPSSLPLIVVPLVGFQADVICEICLLLVPVLPLKFVSWSPVFFPPINSEFSQAFYFFPLFRSVFNQALQDGHGKLTKDNLIARYEVINMTPAEKFLLEKGSKY